MEYQKALNLLDNKTHPPSRFRGEKMSWNK